MFLPEKTYILFYFKLLLLVLKYFEKIMERCKKVPPRVTSIKHQVDTSKHQVEIKTKNRAVTWQLKSLKLHKKLLNEKATGHDKITVKIINKMGLVDREESTILSGIH